MYGVTRFRGSSRCLIIKRTCPFVLERKDADWCWLPIHDESILQIKALVCEAAILKFYDVNQEVTVQSDASLTGLGASLLQGGQPVAFASRALTPTETRYAQIEKELLSVVFACERFDTYLYGRELVNVKTDHQPLESIFKKALGSAPQRLQRMLLRLQRYNLCVKYQKGSSMVMSDPLSRAYVDNPPNQTEYCHELEEIVLVDDLPISEEFLQEFKRSTANDTDLQMLMTVVQDGWPDVQAAAPIAVKPYFHCGDEITVQDGLLFKGDRLIVPVVQRNKMVAKIHSSHLGIEGCLRRAREVFYWPWMNAELKDFILKCDICNSHKPEQPQEPLLMPHEIPLRPWQKVGTDLFQFEGRHYLITVDYYSSFFEVDKLETLDSTAVINKLKMHFSRHGIPEIVISDNGPQYSAIEFSNFAKTWGFHSVTSSPHHPQSNGKAESAVKICKTITKKSASNKFDPYLSLLDLRNTPTEIGSSPAQRLFNRRTCNMLPLSNKLLDPTPLPVQEVQEKLINSKQRQGFHYSLKGTALPELQPGQLVRMKKPGESTWSEATCKKMIGPRSYVVVSGNQTYRRNRRQLRSSQEPKAETTPLPNGNQYHGSTAGERSSSQIGSTDVKSNDSQFVPAVTRSGRITKQPARFQGSVD